MEGIEGADSVHIRIIGDEQHSYMYKTKCVPFASGNVKYHNSYFNVLTKVSSTV